MTQLAKHVRPIPNTLPPLEYLVKHLVPDPKGSTHLFWRDTRANHEHDSEGQAMLAWRVKPTVATHMVSMGRYCVVRLLLQHHGLPVENVENRCGLPQCVNHQHWS